MGELMGWMIIAAIAISGFVGLNDDWTFKRVADRAAFYNYDKTSELKKLIIKDNNSVSYNNVECEFNKVIVKTPLTTKPLDSTALREFERNLAKNGGIDEFKNNIVKEMSHKSKYVDLLQQGLEVEMIMTDTKKTLIDIVVTYKDITDYWKQKN